MMEEYLSLLLPTISIICETLTNKFTWVSFHTVIVIECWTQKNNPLHITYTIYFKN